MTRQPNLCTALPHSKQNHGAVGRETYVLSLLEHLTLEDEVPPRRGGAAVWRQRRGRVDPRQRTEGISTLEERFLGEDNRRPSEDSPRIVEVRALPDVGMSAEETGEIASPKRHSDVAFV